MRKVWPLTTSVNSALNHCGDCGAEVAVTLGASVGAGVSVFEATLALALQETSNNPLNNKAKKTDRLINVLDMLLLFFYLIFAIIYIIFIKLFKSKPLLPHVIFIKL